MQKKMNYAMSVVLLKSSEDQKSYLFFFFLKRIISSHCHGSTQIFQDEEVVLESRLKYTLALSNLKNPSMGRGYTK